MPGACGLVEQRGAVEDAELLAVELEAHAVRVAEVHALLDPAVGPEIVHPRLVELLLRRVVLLRRDGDRQVLHPADGLGERRVLMAREVEEPQQVAVADVEEEVAGTGVVAVLHQLDQREAEELLVELDRLLHVPADQGQVVHSLDGRVRPLAPRAQILVAQPLTARPHFRELGSLRLWHGRLPACSWARRRTATRPDDHPGQAQAIQTGPERVWAAGRLPAAARPASLVPATLLLAILFASNP